MRRKTRIITVNFARTDFRTLLVVKRVLLAVAAAAAAVLVVFVLTARSYRAECNKAEMQVRELAASEEKLRPVMDERKKLVGNLNAMTGLLQSRKFSWTRFLSRLEEVFPEGIALTRLEFQPREQAATLEGYAQSPEALSRLMIDLQRSHAFKNPLLKKQSMDKGILSFDVIVSYNETAADGPAPATAQQPAP